MVNNSSNDSWHYLGPQCPNKTPHAAEVFLRTHSFVGAFLAGLGLVEAVFLACLLLAKYNSVTVMNRRVHISTTSSVRWTFFFMVIAFRCVVFAIFDAYEQNDAKTEMLTTVFVTGSVLQALEMLMLLLALHHEWKCRSTSFAVQGGFFRKRRTMIAVCEFVMSPQSLFCLQCLAALIILVIAEFSLNQSSDDQEGLFWTLCGLILSLRLSAFIMAIIRVADQRRDGPKKSSAIALFIALILGTPGCFPVYLLKEMSPKLVECFAVYASSIEFILLASMVSWLLFFFYVRSEFLRVVQECKHAIIGDIQAMLDFNATWQKSESS